MTLKDRNNSTLRKLEDLIFRARQKAAENDPQIYGMLDDALLRVQYLGMGLKPEREHRPS